MAEIVNLRQARKRAARAEKERVADANRRAHGIPKRERDAARREADAASRHLEAHRLDPPPVSADLSSPGERR